MAGKKDQSGFDVMMIGLLVVLAAAVAVGGYVVYRNGNTYSPSNTNYQPPAASKTSTKAKTAATAPSASALASIKATMTSGNTAALQGYMAASVHWAIAASGGVGDETPAKAVQSLSYVSPATNWDFNLSAAKLAGYQSGNYKSYFPTNALVGMSSNKYLVSFQFDSSGKIDGIFMSNNSDAIQ